MYRFGKHTAGQAFDIEIFHGDSTVVVHQFMGYFVLKIIALMEHMAVQLGGEPTGLAPARRTFDAARHMTLLSAQFLLCPPIITWVSRDFPITGDGERFQAHINANH